MPTDKRERQRAGREARRAEARAAQRRAQRRRQIISVAALVAVVVVIGLVLNLTGGDSGGGDSTSTTTAPKATTTIASTPAVEPVCPPAEGTPERQANFTKAPPDCLTAGASYTATVETDLGSFTIALDRDKAPATVNNFVFLARNHAYDGIPFHRVIPDFVVQGGDVAGQNGTGDAGYKIAEEKPNAGDYKIGSVAMAKSQVPNSTGSQFFVVTGQQGVALPPDYSLFGTVTDGLDVVKKIEADGSPAGTPKVTHKIVKMTINEQKG